MRLPIIYLVAWPLNRTGPLGYEPNVLPSHSPATYLLYTSIPKKQMNI